MSQPITPDTSGMQQPHQSPPVPNDQPPQQQRHIIVNPTSTPDPALGEMRATLASMGQTLAALPEQLVHSFRESTPQQPQQQQQQPQQPQQQQGSAQQQQIQQHQQQPQQPQQPRVMSERKEKFLRGWFGR